MDTLTAPLLQELINHIEVYEIEGVGKKRTQRIVIYYRFVGYIEIPEVPRVFRDNYIANTWQGVTVELSPTNRYNKKSKHHACCYIQNKCATIKKNRVFITQIRYEHPI